jgi:simple sugar transport system permease protein
MIRLERRDKASLSVRITVWTASVFTAFALVTLLLFATGINPFTTYSAMISASISSGPGLTETLTTAVPLILTGLCAAVAFRLKLYNIGGEGQLYMGAAGASLVSLLLGGRPAIVVIICSMIAGIISGCLWALVPALLRAFLTTNEILTTLMFNYVAGYFITYLIFDSASYWRDLTSPGGKVYPTGKTIPLAGWWPTYYIGSVGIPLGFILAAALALLAAFMFKRSTLGYKIRVVAGSRLAGHYGGINIKRLTVGVMLLSGGLAGLAGAAQVGSISHVLDPTSLEQIQYGYSGIVVAAIADFSPIGVVVAGTLIGAIVAAGSTLLSSTFPVGVVGAVEGILLFSFLSLGLLMKYRVSIRTRNASAGRVLRPALPATLASEIKEGDLR